MKKIWLMPLSVLLILIFSLRAKAQQTITVIGGTIPISSDTRLALEAWLNVNPPVQALYFAPTYYLDKGAYQLISLAALNISSPDDPWSMEQHDNEPRTVIWVGTIKLYPDGTAELHSSNPGSSVGHLALPMPGAGGGSYVLFPWAGGRSMMYGPRLIHGEGDFGTSGMYAVDFVGGDSLGTNVAGPQVYASDAGTVDYICADDIQVAVRTHNSTTGDYFIYEHLLTNANLEMDHEFARGALVGVLKYGTFNDTCGWADQGDKVYHVHWMFTPSNGAFRAEDCTLQFSDKKWHCGNQVIGGGGWVSNTSGVGSGVDDPATGTSSVPSFWDGIVNAIVGFVGQQLGLLPEHNSPTQLIRMIINGVDLTFRLAFVFMRGNFNLASIMILLGIALAFRIVFGIIWLLWWIVRFIKQFVPFMA